MNDEIEVMEPPEQPEPEKPAQPEQRLTSAQLQYDWIELYLTPVTS